MATLNIRNVPDEVHRWLREQAHQKGVSLNEFVNQVLASADLPQGQPDLFSASTERTSPESLPFRFIDLFAGVGGFRIAMERLGGRCVFTSEWDKFSQQTYRAWHGEDPVGDIQQVDPADVPDHDILCAGFPCQPFSLAGVSKKNSLGRLHGFADEKQGNLFFTIADIVSHKRPPVLILENVKNLVSHDKKRTWKVIESTLRELNYAVFHKVVDARHWVPQHRERIFIVCFDQSVFGEEVSYQFPEPPEKLPVFREIMESNPDPKYTLSDKLWQYLQNYAEKHRQKGNGFGFGLVDENGTSRTLSARYHKDGSEILIPQGNGNPRKLTPREAARLMGYPDEKEIVVSDTQAYRQFGNSVVPAVVEAVGRQALEVINRQLQDCGLSDFLKRQKANVASYTPEQSLAAQGVAS